MRNRWVFLGLTFSIALGFGLTLAPDAAAQPLKLRVKTIKAPAGMRAKFRTKRRYSSSKVKKSLRYNKLGFPLLKLRRGQSIVLQPVDKVEKSPSQWDLKKAHAKMSGVVSKYMPKPSQPTQPPAAPPTVVNHRSNQTSIKNQGNRGTCVAHASMAGLEAIYKSKYSKTMDLSEQHAFEIFMKAEGSKSCQDQGIQTWRAAGYLTSSRACNNWKYQSSLPSCSITVPSSCSAAAKYGYTTTKLLFSKEFGGAAPTLATDTKYLEGILASGHDIVMGMYVAGGGWSDSSLDTKVLDVEVTASGDPAPAFGGHAMLLVGYNRPGNYFEFKNSWGPYSGHQGYVRVTYDYMKTYSKYGFYITGTTTP